MSAPEKANTAAISEERDRGIGATTNTDPPASGLANHVEEAVGAVMAFRKEHESGASKLQKAIDRVTDGLGRPVIVVVLFAALLAWMLITLLISGNGIDQASFAWLEFTGTLLALLVSLLILVTQRHEDTLAERRNQLTLELALLSDRKNAKIIALLEELRRDMPMVADRIDPDSEDMKEAADPRSVLDAIDRRGDKA